MVCTDAEPSIKIINTVDIPPAEQAKIFLTTLFRGCQQAVELRAINQDRVIRQFYTVEQLTMRHKAMGFIMAWWSDHNITVGVATRQGYRGEAENIREFGCLWCDIDAEKGGIDYNIVGQKIKDFPHRPTFIIRSGRGIHLYWCLEHPITIQHHNDELSLKIQGIERGITQYFYGDMAVTDITRVMRVPGTINLKDPENPLECRIMAVYPARYSLDQFTNFRHDVVPRYRDIEARGVEKEDILKVVEVLNDLGYADSIVNGELVCSCPFHHDGNNPNFRLNLSSGLYYCWSCMEGGNLEKLRNELTDIQLKQYFMKK